MCTEDFKILIIVGKFVEAIFCYTVFEVIEILEHNRCKPLQA